MTFLETEWPRKWEEKIRPWSEKDPYIRCIGNHRLFEPFCCALNSLGFLNFKYVSGEEAHGLEIQNWKSVEDLRLQGNLVEESHIYAKILYHSSI